MAVLAIKQKPLDKPTITRPGYRDFHYLLSELAIMNHDVFRILIRY